MKKFWTEVAHWAGIAVTTVVSLVPGLALNYWITMDLAYGAPAWVNAAALLVSTLLTFVWSSVTIRLYIWVGTGEWVPRPTWARVKAGYQASRRP